MSSSTLDRGGPAPSPHDSPPPDTDPAGLAPAGRAAIDLALADLRAQAQAWAHLAPEERVALLDQIVAGLAAVGPRLVAASLAVKGLPSGAHAEGEEWLAHAGSLRLARLLRRSVAEIARIGHPHLPHPPRPRPDGQTVVQVYPDDIYEELSQFGVRAEVWMQPGVGLEETLTTQAWAYRRPHGGRLAAVLGAGNMSILVVADILNRAFVEGEVVAIKLNPVNAYLAPLLAEAFAPLIGAGYLRLLTGGALEGAYLVHHPLVEVVHLTGSARTYNAVVFGPGEEGARRRAGGRPLLHKPITGELGNVTPVIVVPGLWHPAELQAQALSLATWAVSNGGCLCHSPRVLILHERWPQRHYFLEALGEALAAAPTRPAFYPGAREAQERVLRLHPEALTFGEPGPGELPWALVPGLDPGARGEPCFEEELFGPVLAEVAIDSSDPATFIEQAVAFANNRLWGTLAASIVVHPDSLRDARVRAAHERALFELRYGTVAVNDTPGHSYYLGVTTWGAFPGSTPADIQSGTGVVANAAMLQRPEKSVLTAPFKPMAAPFLLGSHAMPLAARRLAEAQAHPSPVTAARLTVAALGG